MPFSFASRVRRAAHSRTWLTDPGAAGSVSVHAVCMESTTSTSGLRASTSASTRSTLVSAQASTPDNASPSRCPRAATCARLSSPVT
jgi:hypothetical protein